LILGSCHSTVAVGSGPSRALRQTNVSNNKVHMLSMDKTQGFQLHNASSRDHVHSHNVSPKTTQSFHLSNVSSHLNAQHQQQQHMQQHRQLHKQQHKQQHNRDQVHNVSSGHAVNNVSGDHQVHTSHNVRDPNWDQRSIASARSSKRITPRMIATSLYQAQNTRDASRRTKT